MWSDWLKCLVLIQSYFLNIRTATSFNGVTWFLSSLLLSYFFAPILNRILGKAESSCCNLIVALICIIAVNIGFCAIWIQNFETTGISYYLVYLCPVTRCLDFAAGIAAGKIYRKYVSMSRISINKDFFLIIFFGSIWLSVVLMTLCSYVPVVFQYNSLWLPAAVINVLVFASSDVNILPTAMIKLGNISFYCFIWHRLILWVVERVNTGLMGWILALLLTILTSYLCKKIEEYISLSSKWRKR